MIAGVETAGLKKTTPDEPELFSRSPATIYKCLWSKC